MNILTSPQSNQAHIQYFLSKHTEVELSVFDHRGNQVGVLFSDQQKKGRYQFTWDLSEVTSGRYYIQLHTQGRKLIKRFQLFSK